VQWSEINDCGGAPSSSGRGRRHRDLVVILPATLSSRGGAPLDPDGNYDKDDDENDDEDDDNRSRRGSIPPRGGGGGAVNRRGATMMGGGGGGGGGGGRRD
jgi:hypothetical protein